MAISLNHRLKSEEQPQSVSAIVKAIAPSVPTKQIGRSSNLISMSFEEYKDAEILIESLYDAYSESAEFFLCIAITFAEDDAEILLVQIIAELAARLKPAQEGKEPPARHSVFTYVTDDVYKRLPPLYQDLYQRSIESENAIVHERFAKNTPRCFIVSPIGADDSDIRKRADYVFDTYIKPACGLSSSGLRPVRADMMRGTEITPEMKQALEFDPMVIIYLGPAMPGFSSNEFLFNNNVAFEWGIREEAGKPYIVLKDMNYSLPFDFKDIRVIPIPEKPEDIDPKNPKKALDNISLKARTIASLIDNLIEAEPCSSGNVIPSATFDIRIGGGEAKFSEASKELEALFDMTNLVGKDVRVVSEHIKKMMYPCQRKAFDDDQNRILGELLLGGGSGLSVRAKVPIMFNEGHPKYANRAFLAMPLSLNRNEAAGMIRIQGIYIDVTAATKFDEELKYYICQLTGVERELSQSVKQ